MGDNKHIITKVVGLTTNKRNSNPYLNMYLESLILFHNSILLYTLKLIY